MSKRTGLGMRCYVGGNNLSGDVGSLSNIGGGPKPLSVTGIDKSAFERVGGEIDGSIEFSAWFNPTGAHPILAALPTANVTTTVLVGTSLGDPTASCVAKQIGYDGKRGKDGALTFGVKCLSNGYGVEWGIALTAGARTDTAGTAGTGVDLVDVSTAFGWQAYLQVESVTGTSVTVTLEDSDNNAAYTPLTGGAFTAVTPAAAPTAQRLAGGSTDTVRQYVRATTSGVFSEAIFVVQFVRNLTAVTL